jgi:hypothetical protein
MCVYAYVLVCACARVSMHVHIYIYIYVYVYVYICMYVYICTHASILTIVIQVGLWSGSHLASQCTYIHTPTYTCLCTQIRKKTWISTQRYICILLCMYVCVYLNLQETEAISSWHIVYILRVYIYTNTLIHKYIHVGRFCLHLNAWYNIQWT